MILKTKLSYNSAKSVQSDNSEREKMKKKYVQSSMITLAERKENLNMYKKECSIFFSKLFNL